MSTSAWPATWPTALAEASVQPDVQDGPTLPALLVPAIASVPDAATEELLAPVMPSAPASDLPSPANPNVIGDDPFAKALRDGTIPTFPDQPADTAVDAVSPPLDPEAERQAWAALVGMIEAHKDAGTQVTIADPESFMNGLT